MKKMVCVALVAALLSSPAFAGDAVFLGLGQDFPHNEDSWQVTRVAVCHSRLGRLTLETRSGIGTPYATTSMFDVATGDSFILHDKKLDGDTWKQIAELVEMTAIDPTNCTATFDITTLVRG
jgi:hypothetical protein